MESSDLQRLLAKQRARWEGNTIIDLKETGWQVADWIILAHVGNCHCGNGHLDSTKFWEFLHYPGTINFYINPLLLGAIYSCWCMSEGPDATSSRQNIHASSGTAKVTSKVRLK
jgi:hypothetical protein